MDDNLLVELQTVAHALQNRPFALSTETAFLIASILIVSDQLRGIEASLDIDNDTLPDGLDGIEKAILKAANKD